MTNKEYYETRFSYNKKRKETWQTIAGFLQKEIEEDSVILDIGAGYCDLINSIKAREKHALDLYNIRKFADKDVKVYLQSCTNMRNIKLGYFDTVFANNILEHLEMKDVVKTLKEIKRILKPGGKLIIIQPNFRYSHKEYFDDYTHKTIFTDKSICYILASNSFSIEKIKKKFLPFSLKSRLPKSKLLIKIYLYLPIKPFAKQMLVIAKKS